MPLYEYQCESCGHRFERIRKFSDPPLTECPQCAKGPVRKLLSSPAIQFKGSGFYITDYAKPGSKSESDSSGKKDATASSSDSNTKSENKSDKTESSSTSAKSDSKPESTTTTSKSTDKT